MTLDLLHEMKRKGILVAAYVSALPSALLAYLYPEVVRSKWMAIGKRRDEWSCWTKDFAVPDKDALPAIVEERAASLN